MSYVEPKPEKALESQPTFYTEEQLPHIRFTPYLRSLAAEIVGAETNPVVKARRIYDYITTHVMYSFVRSYFTIDNLTEYMGTGLKGDCGIHALLFITLCRIAGIPARWQPDFILRLLKSMSRLGAVLHRSLRVALRGLLLWRSGLERRGARTVEFLFWKPGAVPRSF